MIDSIVDKYLTEATKKQRIEASIGKGFKFGSDRYEIVGYSDSKTHPVKAKRTNRQPHEERNFTMEAARVK